MGGRSRRALASGVAILAVIWQFGATMAHGQIDITARGPDGLPGIFWLIKQQDQSAVGAWLDAGGSIETPGFQRATPVLTAAIIDDWPMVVYLLDRGARMDVVDRRGFTLPWLASHSRAAPGGILGPALQEVRNRLAAAGLLSRVYDPTVVRAMLAEGRWPPAPG